MTEAVKTTASWWGRVAPYAPIRKSGAAGRIFGVPAGCSAAAQISGYVNFVPVIEELIQRWQELTRAFWSALFGKLDDYIRVPLGEPQYDALSLFVLCTVTLMGTLYREGPDHLARTMNTGRWQMTKMIYFLGPSFFFCALLTLQQDGGPYRLRLFDISGFVIAWGDLAGGFFAGVYALICLAGYVVGRSMHWLYAQLLALIGRKAQPFQKPTGGFVAVVVGVPVAVILSYDWIGRFNGFGTDIYQAIWFAVIYASMMIALFGYTFLNWRYLYYVLYSLLFIILVNWLLKLVMPIWNAAEASA